MPEDYPPTVRPLIAGTPARVLLSLLAVVVAYPLLAFVAYSLVRSAAFALLAALVFALVAVAALALLAWAIANVLSVDAGRAFTWLAWSTILGCLVTYLIVLGSAE